MEQAAKVIQHACSLGRLEQVAFAEEGRTAFSSNSQSQQFYTEASFDFFSSENISMKEMWDSLIQNLHII